ncbi:ribokinase [Niabella yanshanensis]|uniref:Ribokinase n=1 Tax=Niabella yanshanensis TaxID=577386 RepID=A0ABZ0W7Q4_9BACT|nr:ribokinase [Niabella yanshanensis]WQD38564.1 ribokinase [Niabella yanshanensis]
MNKTIVIIGSSNTDMVIRTPYFPTRGETIIGADFLMNAGGKGANQAVTVARLAGNASFICRVGNDLFGNNALALFQKEGIDTTYISRDASAPSGIAIITVNDAAENTIVVAPGANALLDTAQVDEASEKIQSAAYLLMQLEIPLETVMHAARMGFDHKVPIILNPAPARTLPDELYQWISIITPNEKEASLLTGVEVEDEVSARRAAKILADKGVAIIIITMGSHGALLYDGSIFTHIATPVVDAIDTTAAGDVFNGALVVALSEGKDLADAVSFACDVSAISVTRRGAQSSVPYRSEVS